MKEEYSRFTAEDLSGLEQRFRTTLMNSLAGARQAILVGSSNSKGQTNLALFNSLVHIGANPPLQGLVFRPAEVERHTLENILETQYYSLNYVPLISVPAAHQTSARYPRTQSEFDAAGFTPLYLEGYPCPLVEQSPIRIILKKAQIVPLDINKTQLVIGSVEEVIIRKELLQPDGLVDSSADTVVALGLDTYLRTSLHCRMAYAKPDLAPRKL